MKRRLLTSNLIRSCHSVSPTGLQLDKAITIAGVALLCAALSSCSQIDSLLNRDNHQSLEVARAVKTQLVDDQLVDAAPLRVSVSNSTIVLEGYVDDIDQRNKAERIARNLYPDYDILNQIAVR